MSRSRIDRRHGVLLVGLATACGAADSAAPAPATPTTPPAPAGYVRIVLPPSDEPPEAVEPVAVEVPPPPPAPVAPPPPRRPLRDPVVYEGRFDDHHQLVLRTQYATADPTDRAVELVVSLVDPADGARWEIDRIPTADEGVKVRRVDPGAVVLLRRGFYPIDHDCVKLYVDPSTRRKLDRFTFRLQADASFHDDAEAQVRLGLSADQLATVRDRRVLAWKGPAIPTPPTRFTSAPMPVSTWKDFAKARPRRVANGYDEDTWLDEHLGAWQLEGDRMWFGKAFYDAEGSSGVGAIGSVGADGAYAFLAIPEVVDFSVDALLVEPATIWAGLVDHGEGWTISGGLLEVDRPTGRARVHDVVGPIHTIVRVDDALFLGTQWGPYVLRDGTITWHHTEPGVNGRSVVVTEVVGAARE